MATAENSSFPPVRSKQQALRQRIECPEYEKSHTDEAAMLRPQGAFRQATFAANDRRIH